MSNYIPAYDLGEPGRSGGYSICINPSDMVYSTYSGEKISNGPINKGRISDAPPGHKNHGKPFHDVERDSKGYLMVHGMQSRR
jgi:hypothetical protein